VGVRTLQRCFREYFNITVSNYLKAVRLDSARRELVAAHHSNTSVTRIAMQNGCTHLGRFSVEFRERFGQSPRQALAMHRPKSSIGNPD
jgi:transcriptional regulator GlxA family with amidase domain